MSNAFAIAAVTATLYNLLDSAAKEDDEFSGVDVSTQAPDVARKDKTGDQINIFLYHTSVNSAFSNAPMPGRTRKNENGRPPLALNLHYLVTAYGDGDNDVRAHLLLGLAMLRLHDYNQFTVADLRSAISAMPALDEMQPDLHEQIEGVKITPQPLSLEEMSKLWTTFQTQYRISTAYHVSVVLIESKRPIVAALPVARRTNDDYVDSQSNLLPPFPTLTGAVLKQDKELKPDDLRRRTTFLPNDTILLTGHHLMGDLDLQFAHPRLSAPLTIPVDNTTANRGKDGEITFTLPAAPQVWLAGVYSLSVLVKDSVPPRTSNALPFLIAPSMRINLPVDAEGYPSVALPAGGDLTLTIDVDPMVSTDSRVVLLFSGRELVPQNIPSPPPQPPERRSILRFELTGLETKDYPLRLRVDGVDSLLIDVTKSPAAYKPDQQLRVT